MLAEGHGSETSWLRQSVATKVNNANRMGRMSFSISHCRAGGYWLGLAFPLIIYRTCYILL